MSKLLLIGEAEMNQNATLLKDDKAFGRAMARLIAYVRKHAVWAGDRAK